MNIAELVASERAYSYVKEDCFYALWACKVLRLVGDEEIPCVSLGGWDTAEVGTGALPRLLERYPNVSFYIPCKGRRFNHLKLVGFEEHRVQGKLLGWIRRARRTNEQ